MSTTLSKTPNESYIYTIDFSHNMDLGETIVSITSLYSPQAGIVVASPDYPVIANQQIQFRVSGGVNKGSYLIVAVVATSKGNTLEHGFVLNVRNSI